MPDRDPAQDPIDQAYARAEAVLAEDTAETAARADRRVRVLAARNVFPGRTPVNFAGDATLTRYELAHIVSALYAVNEPPSTFIALRDAFTFVRAND